MNSNRLRVRIVDKDRVALEDLDSKNGTFVDGTRSTSRVEVHDRAQIRFGYLTLTLRAITPDDPTATEL